MHVLLLLLWPLARPPDPLLALRALELQKQPHQQRMIVQRCVRREFAVEDVGEPEVRPVAEGAAHEEVADGEGGEGGGWRGGGEGGGGGAGGCGAGGARAGGGGGARGPRVGKGSGGVSVRGSRILGLRTWGGVLSVAGSARSVPGVGRWGPGAVARLSGRVGAGEGAGRARVGRSGRAMAFRDTDFIAHVFWRGSGATPASIGHSRTSKEVSLRLSNITQESARKSCGSVFDFFVFLLSKGLPLGEKEKALTLPVAVITSVVMLRRAASGTGSFASSA